MLLICLFKTTSTTMNLARLLALAVALCATAFAIGPSRAAVASALEAVVAAVGAK
jgi:predicted membrane protein